MSPSAIGGRLLKQRLSRPVRSCVFCRRDLHFEPHCPFPVNERIALNEKRVSFQDVIGEISSEQVCEFGISPTPNVEDVSKMTFAAFQAPIDFPPLGSAIVPGDHVALAVDPNIPRLPDVIAGVLNAVRDTDAGDVEIVLWDEATDATVAELREVIDDSVAISRHNPEHRDSLRYLGADRSADPVYLNRRVVDADFTLPIVAARPTDSMHGHDLTGVFLALADSASRQRLCDWSPTESPLKDAQDEIEPAWLLGLQLLLSVRANAAGNVAEIRAGTLEAIGKQITPDRREADSFPPAAPLVVASLDGGQQQQTWVNAARAAASAARFATADGMIVLWTEIDQRPSSTLACLADGISPAQEFVPTEENAFPHWDQELPVVLALQKLLADHRVMIHSRVDSELIESMGLGAIDSPSELNRLSQSFPTCGVLRSAQFAGSTVIGIE